MIKLTAEISFVNTDKERQISKVCFKHGSVHENPKNIVSISADISSLKNKSVFGANPFVLGSALGKKVFWDNQDKVDFYIGSEISIPSEISDEIGVFQNSYEIELDCPNGLENLTIEFDKIDGGFPKTIIVDDEVYENDDAIFTVFFDNTEAISHSVEIKDWNAPFEPLIITGIYELKKIKIDQRNLISLETNLFDRENYEKVGYGIHSNSGTVEFKDYNGEIEDYFASGALKENMPIKVFLVDTLSKKETVVCTMFTGKWEYDSENKQVTVPFSDGIETWQDVILTSAYPKNPKPDYPRADELYNGIWSKIPSKVEDRYKTKYNIPQYILLPTNNLKDIVLEYVFLQSASLWSFWQSICEVSLSHIFIDEQGKFKFIQKDGR